MSTSRSPVRRLIRALALLLLLSASARGAGLPTGGPVAPSGARFQEADAALIQVLQLADQRLEMMSAVAAWKWQHHVPIADPAREQTVIAQAGGRAQQLGLDPAAIEHVFALQVTLARTQEQRLEHDWQTRGFDYRGQAPDLQHVLRPRLNRLTGQLLRGLYRAAPLSDGPHLQAHYARLAARWLRAPGWSPRSRSQLLEALHAIGAPRGPALDRIHGSGLLRVGTTGDYAPFSLEAAGRLSGADISLARSLAASLGARAVFIRTSWPHLLGDLQAGRFDLAMGGISITPGRSAVAAFSLPYYTGGKTILARCLDAARFTNLASLDQAGVRLIVNPGGTNQQFVSARVHRAQVLIEPDNRRVFADIAAGRADAMITDDAEVALQVRAHPALCRAMRGTLTTERKAILMPRDPGLVLAVDRWLRGELSRGRPAELLREQLRSADGPAVHP